MKVFTLLIAAIATPILASPENSESSAAEAKIKYPFSNVVDGFFNKAKQYSGGGNKGLFGGGKKTGASNLRILGRPGGEPQDIVGALRGAGSELKDLPEFISSGLGGIIASLFQVNPLALGMLPIFAGQAVVYLPLGGAGFVRRAVLAITGAFGVHFKGTPAPKFNYGTNSKSLPEFRPQTKKQAAEDEDDEGEENDAGGDDKDGDDRGGGDKEGDDGEGDDGEGADDDE